MGPRQRLKVLGWFALHFKKPTKSSTHKASDTASHQINKMASAVTTAQEVLLEVSSAFPFIIFPDTLKVDRQKVIIIHRNFFQTAQIINIQIGDLQSIEADVGPFFGTISITTKQFSNTVNKAHRLSRRDVLEAQSLLQGFVIANKKELNHSEIEKNQLIQLLKELGQGQTS
jgi:hypothetical protein